MIRHSRSPRVTVRSDTIGLEFSLGQIRELEILEEQVQELFLRQREHERVFAVTFGASLLTTAAASAWGLRMRSPRW